MKLSLSMSEDDVEFIDQYASEHGVHSRSAVVQRAVSLLRAGELGDDYAAAWTEWDRTDAELWDEAVGDGVESGTP
ncbi:MAG TPA: ribbon-helix-helix domain-containing protein [Nocardioidaceae bacterium]